jgi:penicillin-binding protein 1C
LRFESAIIALEELGPDSFETELKSLIGHNPKNNKRAGLSLAVGGFYLNAEQLAKLYLTALDPGYAIDLSFGSINTKAFERTDPSLFYEETSKQILHLLIQDLPNGERW